MIDITTKIVETLTGLLPASIPVYRNRVESGVQEPSFFVHQIATNQQRELAGYAMRSYTFHIAYLPDPEKPSEDIERAQDWLLNNLQTIGDNYAHVFNQEFTVVDNVLHYQFAVPVRTVTQDADSVLARQLDYQGGLKNG